MANLPKNAIAVWVGSTLSPVSKQARLYNLAKLRASEFKLAMPNSTYLYLWLSYCGVWIGYVNHDTALIRIIDGEL